MFRATRTDSESLRSQASVHGLCCTSAQTWPKLRALPVWNGLKSCHSFPAPGNSSSLSAVRVPSKGTAAAAGMAKRSQAGVPWAESAVHGDRGKRTVLQGASWAQLWGTASPREAASPPSCTLCKAGIREKRSGSRHLWGSQPQQPSGPARVNSWCQNPSCSLAGGCESGSWGANTSRASSAWRGCGKVGAPC